MEAKRNFKWVRPTAPSSQGHFVTNSSTPRGGGGNYDVVRLSGKIKTSGQSILRPFPCIPLCQAQQSLHLYYPVGVLYYHSLSELIALFASVIPQSYQLMKVERLRCVTEEYKENATQQHRDVLCSYFRPHTVADQNHPKDTGQAGTRREFTSNYGVCHITE